MRGVDAVAVDAVDDEHALRSGAAFSDHLGHGEGEEGADARRERVQGARFGGEVGGRLFAGRHADDDLAPVGGARESGIEATGGVLGQGADVREGCTGQGRCRRRG